MDKLEQVSENPELKEEMESEVTRYGFKKMLSKIANFGQKTFLKNRKLISFLNLLCRR